VQASPPKAAVPVQAIGPRLRWVLRVVLALFALLAVNSVYLASVTVVEWSRGVELQDEFYLLNVLLHLLLGLLLVVPVVLFGALHWRNARGLPNRLAARVGIALFLAALLLLVSGLLLTPLELGGMRWGARGAARSVVYWLHVAAPIAAIWLFTIHRLAGPRIRWRVGGGWALAAVAFAGAMLLWHGATRRPPPVPPEQGAAWLEPSLARTATGEPIPLRSLQMNHYCLECHGDTYARWEHSVHAMSSFNNPAYAFSVRETRRVLLEREGSLQGARFCGGCHDPVPLLAGLLDDPRFDDPHFDPHDPIGSASISCTVCHSVVEVRGTRGNAEFTIEESPQYPFTFSESPLLQWVNRQLILAKPSFHKRTFLKPQIHRSGEFCATCHKVFIPESLNDYRWLPGQNHWDSFRLSGVSGHGVTSWYYPPSAIENCNACHMPEVAAPRDLAGKVRAPGAGPTVRDHLFPGANPAIACLTGHAACQELVDELQAFNDGAMRLDLFGVRVGGEIDSPLVAPLGPQVPALRRGETYLIETVLRNLGVGHEFTQGTADSNEVWLDVTVTDGRGDLIGRLGGFGPGRSVDPWARFYNQFLVNRDGERIDRRNVQEIFTALYNLQVPAGSGDVTHLRLRVPEDAAGPIRVHARVRYRKFDTAYLRMFMPAACDNDLPILLIAEDSIEFPVESIDTDGEGDATPPPPRIVAIPEWERWHDYAIGLFRRAEPRGARGPLRQADEAFARVEALAPGPGALGRARVALRDGRLDDAGAALRRAVASDPPAYPWSTTWFSAQVDREFGRFGEAAERLRRLVRSDFAEAQRRGFDFSRDDRLLARLADTLLLQAMGLPEGTARRALLEEARDHCEAALRLDLQQAETWYILAQVAEALGDAATAAEALRHHATYKPDDNARDRAVQLARLRYPAANHAAEAIVIYDLQRPGAHELPDSAVAPSRGASHAAERSDADSSGGS
jgi:tetratricopeptide (TPR) repeat protein